MPGRGTTDSIFILRQQDLFLKKGIHFMLVDLEKSFDRMLHKVLWWTMGTLGFEEWIISTVGAIYEFPGCKVLAGKFSKEFGIKVDIHQGYALRPLLYHYRRLCHYYIIV